MHRRTTSKHGFTKFIMAWTWGKPPPSPFIVYFVPSHGTNTQMSFCHPKFTKLGLLRLWGPIALRVDLWLTWSFKQSCNLCQDLSDGISHATCTQQNWSDSQLLVVRNRIVNLIPPDPSFGHNLCLKCPNGSWELILNIYVPRNFQ